MHKEHKKTGFTEILVYLGKDITEIRSRETCRGNICITYHQIND